MENNAVKLAKTMNLKDFTRNISDEMRNSFLDYSMSVIVSRALPDARDGLKPVHRRILYALHNLGMTHDKPYKKSARIVGEIIGKYHPHGDTAIYDTMVRMAQDFSYRYPLVDGHGNFGSIDGDGAAAMRYTESRMSKIAGELVKDLNKKTVPFVDNYDGSEREPTFLPSYFPNLLVNGTSGIAVAMATNIPPHNLGEIIDAVKFVALNKDCDILSLLDFVKGPDFPTGGFILGENAFKTAYLTGRGIVKMRAKTKFETLNNNKAAIIIEEIPYQIKKNTLIANIVEKIQSKKVQYVTDLRDESNRDGIRIVLEIKNEAYNQLILNQLFKYTNLQCSFAINLVALEDNQPKLLNLKQLFDIYIKHQIVMITKKSEFELEKSLAQSHILSGLVIALDKIDIVINLIRSSKDNSEAVQKLNGELNLSVEQAKAILDMKLQRLTGLEKSKLQSELSELEKNIANLRELLSSESNKIAFLIERLENIKKNYNDQRRTQIITDYEDDIIDESLIKEEQVIITLSNNGYIKRVPLETYKTQNRGGVGVKGTANSDSAEEYVSKIIVASTHSDLLFFTDKGKVYRIRTYKVPMFSRTAKGVPVINLINKEKTEQIKTIINIKKYNNEESLFFVTKKGIVKKTKLKDFRLIQSKGKLAIKLKPYDQLVEVIKIIPNNEVIIAASNGRAVRFNENKIRSMSRIATGVKGMSVGTSQVVGICDSQNTESILAISEKGYGKASLFVDYRITNRGSKGVISMKTNSKTGKLFMIKSLEKIYSDNELLIITLQGLVIRLCLSNIRIMGRNTSGVKLIRLKSLNDKIASVALLTNEQLNSI